MLMFWHSPEFWSGDCSVNRGCILDDTKSCTIDWDVTDFEKSWVVYCCQVCTVYWGATNLEKQVWETKCYPCGCSLGDWGVQYLDKRQVVDCCWMPEHTNSVAIACSFTPSKHDTMTQVYLLYYWISSVQSFTFQYICSSNCLFLLSLLDSCWDLKVDTI